MVHEFHLPGSLYHGAGSLEKLADAAAGLGAHHLFVVISSSVLREPLNLNARLKSILVKADLSITIYSGLKGEPTTEHVKEAVNCCMESQADCIVAIGGGSAIDLAKAVSVFAVIPDIQYKEIPSLKIMKRLPLIAVPTTAGTGSEATKVMVITDVESGTKMNPGHPGLIPDIAILDPELTETLPESYTAYTGMDALAHALEAYVSTRATEMSDYFAVKAISLISKALPISFKQGSNLEARENMLLGSCFAGIAFSNSSTNLAHAAGRALGARFHMTHGLSVALLLPFVIEYGLKASQEKYARIGNILNPEAFGSEGEMAQEVLKMVVNLNNLFHIWEAGAAYINQTREGEIPLLVDDALAGNGILTNQVVPGHDDIKKIYQKLFDKISEYSVLK
ncbi:iron-containing alcohol dehydrogenase family protein [Mesobacillus jeotgali]|uniref:iron-containing alcohol dehydrogenase family protein n=1 Tax=Mesobacillus jeotgali TaxID=129985 RepID=UPI00177FD400|nr:iron-containing alcohol dehydrogenase [Mesobacillus jeotgali]UYZ23871.1 iron-containing alcohol dehydrogenase [Mesobacillus jeotgali]